MIVEIGCKFKDDRGNIVYQTKQITSGDYKLTKFMDYEYEMNYQKKQAINFADWFKLLKDIIE